MPKYKYKCLDCNNIFDIEATIQEKEEGKSKKFTCPKCQSKNIKHKMFSLNFIKNIFQGNDESGSCCTGSTCDEKSTKKATKQKGCCGGGNCCG